MRTAALLLPLALAATFTSAPLLAAPATAAPTTATKSQLHLQTFHPGPQAMFPVSSVLIEGRHDAILVNAQFGASDARKLVELIRASGKQLTTIYISHGDPDYYFGLATLQDAFPQARIVATAQTVAHIQQTQAGKLAYWGPKMGADVPRMMTPATTASRRAPVNTSDSRLSAAGGVAGFGRSRQRHARSPNPSSPIVPIQSRSWL